MWCCAEKNLNYSMHRTGLFRHVEIKAKCRRNASPKRPITSYLKRDKYLKFVMEASGMLRHLAVSRGFVWY